MDDEGGEPIYEQAQGLRSGRLPQKISYNYKLLSYIILCFRDGFNIQGWGEERTPTFPTNKLA